MNEDLGYKQRWDLVKIILQAGIDRFDAAFPNTRDKLLRATRDQNEWLLDQMSRIEQIPAGDLDRVKLEEK